MSYPNVRPAERPTRHEAVYRALDKLLRRAEADRTTGFATLKIDLNQGNVRRVILGGEEVYQDD